MPNAIGIGVGVSPVFGGQPIRHPFEVSNATWWIDAGLEPQTAAGASAQWVLNRGDARVGHAREGSAGRAELRGRFGLLLPGSSGNWASVPYNANFYPDDIDILVRWTPRSTTTNQVIVGNTTTGNGWRLALLSTNTPRFTIGGVVDHNATAPQPYSVGQTHWLRAHRDKTAGELKFYTAPDSATIPATWTQLGNTVVSTSTMTTNTNATLVGGTPENNAPLNADVLRVIVYNGNSTSSGTVVFDADFTTAPEFASSFTAATGQTVTINATSGADSNDPLLLAHTGTNYLYLPGVSGNDASASSAAVFNPNGASSIRIELDIAADNWNSASSVFNLRGDSSNFGLNANGTLLAEWFDSTATYRSTSSTTAVSFANGTRGSIAVEISSAGNVDFYTAITFGEWVSLGTTKTVAAASGFASHTGPLRVGSYNNNGGRSAKYYRCRYLIDGTVVFDADFTTGITSGGQTTFTESSSNAATVTINRSTSGRKSVAVVRPVWLFGTDDYMEVADNDLLDFGASESFTVMAVVRQWHYNAIQVIARKRPASNPGWSTAQLTTAGSELEFVIEGPASTSATSNVAGGVVGSLQTATFVRNVASDTIASYRNGISGTPVTDTTTSSLANSGSLLIGRREVSPELYLNAELFAVAVWRRALTAAEITAITNYYGAA